MISLNEKLKEITAEGLDQETLLQRIFDTINSFYKASKKKPQTC